MCFLALPAWASRATPLFVCLLVDSEPAVPTATLPFITLWPRPTPALSRFDTAVAGMVV